MTLFQDSPQKQEPFPKIEATTLSGKAITLPAYVQGKQALVVVAFRRQAQGKIDSWRKPFMEKYTDSENYTFLEIPMIGSGWKLASGWIDNGMRSGVPRFLHNNVATYYGPLQAYFKALGIADKSDAYVFLLSTEGNIRWRGRGYASTDKLQALFEHLN